MNSDVYRQDFVIIGDKWKRLSTKPSAQDYAAAAMKLALLNGRLDLKYPVRMPRGCMKRTQGKGKRSILSCFNFFQDLKEII